MNTNVSTAKVKHYQHLRSSFYLPFPTMTLNLTFGFIIPLFFLILLPLTYESLKIYILLSSVYFWNAYKWNHTACIL